MKRATTVIAALFRCGIVGALYGAALGVIYGVLLVISGALRARDNAFLFLFLLTLAIPYGAILGFSAGFISGVLGGSLGGPIGYSIGGFIGAGAPMLLFFGGAGGMLSNLPFPIYPSIWGAAFGLVLGLHIRRRERILPGAKYLTEAIYSSPLGAWPGWRQGEVK